MGFQQTPGSARPQTTDGPIRRTRGVTENDMQASVIDASSCVFLRASTMSHKQIYYSDKYDDDKYEYRHVMLPKEIAKRVPKTHLMSETEWRNLGVQQSQGWVHYMIHQPEPHILLFRRPLPNQKS
uniref:Cyclin-dependent kinases regulatory subunit n=1 Tax=Oryzias sinensis TaxID=183150 RepID=A0A8C7WQ62_9TELE